MFDNNTNIILNAQSLQAKIIIIFEIHRKIITYSHYVDCGFKKFETKFETI